MTLQSVFWTGIAQYGPKMNGYKFENNFKHCGLPGDGFFWLICSSMCFKRIIKLTQQTNSWQVGAKFTI